ncbi:hypothetical protein N692_00100 [Lactiplantibacillus plantarum EGD-AQ4]|nr:hypothetical protein N692_00100 [Lactiplantibacillus plantarum EGD-AQ4]
MIETSRRKQRELRQALSQQKEHFRMYKANKFWIYAGVSVILFGAGSFANSMPAEASSNADTTASSVANKVSNTKSPDSVGTVVQNVNENSASTSSSAMTTGTNASATAAKESVSRSTSTMSNQSSDSQSTTGTNEAATTDSKSSDSQSTTGTNESTTTNSKSSNSQSTTGTNEAATTDSKSSDSQSTTGTSKSTTTNSKSSNSQSTTSSSEAATSSAESSGSQSANSGEVVKSSAKSPGSQSAISTSEVGTTGSKSSESQSANSVNAEASTDLQSSDVERDTSGVDSTTLDSADTAVNGTKASTVDSSATTANSLVTTLTDPTSAAIAATKAKLAATYDSTETPQKFAAVAAAATGRTVTATFKTISSSGSATTVGTMSWNLTLDYHYDLTATFPLIVVDKNKAATLWNGTSTIPSGSTLYVADINGYYKNRQKTYFLSSDSTASSTIATIFVTPADNTSAKTYTTVFEAVTSDNNTPVSMWSVTGVAGTKYDYSSTYNKIQAIDSTGATQTYYLAAADAPKLIGAVGSATQIVTLHYSLYTSNVTVSADGTSSYTGQPITQADLLSALTGTEKLQTSSLTLSDFQFLNEATGQTTVPTDAGQYIVGLTDAGKAKLTAANPTVGITYAEGTYTITPIDAGPVDINSQQITYGQTAPETYSVTVGDHLTTDGITWAANDFQVVDGTTGTVMTSGLQVGGDYQIQLTASGRAKIEQANPNYDFQNATFNNGKLTVTKLAVTVTASDVTKAFGQKDPALTLKDATGVVVNGDGVDALAVTLTREAGEKVGHYAITGTSTSANYDVTVEPGDFQITNTAPVIDASDVTVPYATTDDLLTLIHATATDAEDGDLTSQIKIADDGNFDSTVVGSYQVTLQVTDQADETTQKVVTVTVAEPTTVSAQVTFIDQATGQTVGTQTLSGKPGTTPTTKVSVPTNYTLVAGEGFVDNGDGTITDTQPLTLDDSDNLTVYLQHATSVTEPPTNVDDEHYAATHKTFTVVITATAPNNDPSLDVTPTGTTTQTLTYTRTMTVDDVTGEVLSYGDWTTTDDYTTVTAKVIAGYSSTDDGSAQPRSITTADVKDQLTAFAANQDTDNDQAGFNITYTANPATLTVTYVDDDDQQSIVTTDELTGITGASGDYETTGKFDSTKYELAAGQAAEVSYQFAADPDTSDNLTIHLVHQHTSALPDGFSGQTAQIVVYVGAGRLTPSTTAPLIITWTTDTDLVTGVTTYTPTNQTAAVTSPQVPNYTPDKAIVPASTFASTTDMPANTQVTVTYLQTTFTPGNPGTVDGTQAKYLTHTVTYDVHYATGSTATDPDTVTKTFYRQANIATDGKTVTYTAWTTDPSGDPAKGQATSEIAALTELGMPAGYTAIVKTTTTAANADGTLGQATVTGNEPVTVDGQVATVLRNVTYTANPANLTITLVDDNRQGAQVGSIIQLTGVTDATGRYTVTVPENYILADGQSGTVSYTFAPNQTDDDGNVVENSSDNVVVHLQHAHSTELPAGFTGTTTNTVTYVGLPTAKSPGNQQQTVTWTTSTDLVTGVTTYTPTNQTNAVQTPPVAGYTPDTTVVLASDYTTTTTAPTDQLTRVTYSANEATLQVTYVDVDNGNSLVGTPTTLTGQTDETGHYDASAHFDQTKYELADGQATTVPYTFAAGTATSDNLVIKLQHKRVTTLPDDFTGTTTETVHYVGAGSATPADHSQTITWTTSTDLVTGVTTYTPTNQAVAVESPVVTGYQPDLATVVGTNYLSTTVQPTNQVTTVTYVKNVKMVTPPTDKTDSHYADTHKQFTETVQAVVPSGVDADLTPDNSSQTLNYARTYEVDATTGVATGNYGAWTLESDDFVTVIAKTLPGYQAAPATVSETNFAAELQAFVNDTSVTDATHVDYIQYVANTDTAATIQYVDTTTNTSVKLDTVVGTTNTVVDYTVSVPEGYEIETAKSTVTDGEQLPIKLMADDTDNLTIYLKHATQTVLPTDPTYAAETNAEVVRVINYQYRDGTQAANPYSDNLFFTRTITVDQVTNQIVAYGDWVPTTTATFAAKDSPVIPGYTATMATVPAKTVAATDQQVVFTVTYQANPDTAATINYLDVETGHNVQTTTIQGATDTTSDYPVKVPAGYVLADTQPATIHNGEVSVTFKADDSDDVTIYLTHDSLTIDPNDPQTKPDDPIPGDSGKTYGDYTTATTATVTRTINYLYGDTANKAADSRVQSVSFTRSITVDQVTGEILSAGDWTVVSEKSDFAAVASPTIPGYTADQEVVVASKPTGDTADTTINVRYTANHDTTATVSYVDEETGQTVKSDQPSGTTDTTVDYQIDVPNGYVIDASRSNYQNGQQLSIVLKGTNDDDVTIYLTHDSLTIDPNDPETKPDDPIPGDSGKTYGDYTKATNVTVTRTINYLYGDTATKAADSRVQTVSFTRSITVDQVTGEILSTGNWTVVGKTADFTAVSSPIIAGYTADKRTVSASAPTGDTPDETVNVRYTANQDTIATVSYIDEQTGETVKSDQPAGTTDTTVDYQIDVPRGYVIDTSRSDYQNGQQLSIVLKGTNADDVTIYLTHDSLTINPNDPQTKPVEPIPGGSGKTYGNYTKATNATVTRTINYLYGDTANEAADSRVQTVSFSRSITVDQVTGEILSTGDWTVVGKTADFAAVVSPTIAGYTADESTVSASTPTGDTDDTTINVHYTANHDTTATVSYVDEQTGETVKSDQPVGTTDTTVSYQVNVPNGYVIDTTRSNYQNGQQLSIVLKGTNADDVTIYLTHDSLTINPNDPETKPDDPIPGGSGKTYGDYQAATQSVATRAIHYVDGRTGQSIAKQVSQSLLFERTITIDAVTGAITAYGQWQPTTTNRFAAIKSPSIEDFMTKLVQVPSAEAVPGKHAQVTVQYMPRAHSFTVTPTDTTGQPLPGVPAIQLTGVTGDPIRIPEIPGYEFVGVTPRVPARGGLKLVYVKVQTTKSTASTHHQTVTETSNKVQVTTATTGQLSQKQGAKSVPTSHSSEKSGTQFASDRQSGVIQAAKLGSSKRSASVKAGERKNQNVSAARLPQTGESSSRTLSITGMLALVLSFLGLAGTKKRKHEKN